MRKKVFIMTDHFTEFVKRTTSRMPAQEIPFWQQAPECIQILCGSGHNALLLLRQRFRWLLSGQEARVGSYRSGMQRQDSYNFQKHRLCPARENFSRWLWLFISSSERTRATGTISSQILYWHVFRLSLFIWSVRNTSLAVWPPVR